MSGSQAAISGVIRRIVCFHFVCVSWVFFRAETVHGAAAMIADLGHFHWSSQYAPALLFLAILWAIGLGIDILIENGGKEYLFQGRSAKLVLGWAASEMVLLAFFSGSGSHAFIYFQF